MPQFFESAVMTNAGAALLARSLSDNVSINIVSLVVGDGSYTNAEKAVSALKLRTALKSQKVAYTPTSIIRENNAAKLTALITNVDPDSHEAIVTSGFYINEIGLMAELSDHSTEPILFSVCVTSETRGDYMPAYTGNNPVQIIQGYVTNISNDANVTFTSPVSAYALVTDVQDVRDKTNGLHTTVADNTEGIAKIVPSGVQVKSARLARLHGSTIVHNQLVKNGNFVGTTNWSGSNATISAGGNVLTITPTNQYGYLTQEVTLVSGHKYLLRADTKRASGEFRAGLGHNNTFSREGVIVTLSSDNAWHTSAIIGTYTSDAEGTGATRIFIGNRSAEDFSPISVRRVKVVDLTQQYGSGNEPSTVDEYIARGGNLDVEDYDAGTLTDCKPEAVKVTGKNLAYLSDGNLTASNSTYSRIPNGIRAVATSAVYPAVNVKIPDRFAGYHVVASATRSVVSGNANPRLILKFVVNGTAEYSENSADIPLNATGIEVRLMIKNTTDTEVGSTVDFANIQLEISDVATAYEPYHESTLTLPTALTSLDGFGRKGTVVDFEKKTMTVTYGKRAYQSGDEDDATVITDGTNTVYPLDEDTTTDITSQLATFAPYLEAIETGGLVRLIFGEGGVDIATRYDVFYDSVYDALASHSEEIKELKARETQPTVNVIDNLTSTSTTDALSANQGRVLKGLIPSVVDNLSSTSATSALSAKQGKTLKDLIDARVSVLAKAVSRGFTQLCANGVLAEVEGFAYVANTSTNEKVWYTASGNASYAFMRLNAIPIVGHKYFVNVNTNIPHGSGGYYIQYARTGSAAIDNLGSAAFFNGGSIWTCGGTQQTSATNLAFIVSYGGSASLNTSNYVQVECIDLTEAFGAGNEPTADEFKVMFTDEYYKYNVSHKTYIQSTAPSDTSGVWIQ